MYRCTRVYVRDSLDFDDNFLGYTCSKNNILTEIGRVVVLWAIQTYGLQIRYGVLTRTLVHAVTLGHYVHVIEHFVRAGAGLMDRANYRPAAFGQAFQDGNALMRTRAVQTAGKYDFILYKH